MIRILKRYTESDEALCEGYSDYDWCCFYSVNKGLAVREKKREEERSAKHGGLYNPQIRLVPRETAIAVKQRYDNRWNEEW
jgi:hypothetical protein